MILVYRQAVDKDAGKAHLGRGRPGGAQDVGVADLLAHVRGGGEAPASIRLREPLRDRGRLPGANRSHLEPGI